MIKIREHSAGGKISCLKRIFSMVNILNTPKYSNNEQISLRVKCQHNLTVAKLGDEDTEATVFSFPKVTEKQSLRFPKSLCLKYVEKERTDMSPGWCGSVG